MRDTEKFLDLYREYETILRDRGMDPKKKEEIEEMEDSTRGGRLRMCRLFRNYLAHQSDAGFLAISPEMLTFMEREVSALKMEGDVLRKHLKTPAAGSCTPKDRCMDVCGKMCKLKLDDFLVVTENGFFQVSLHELLPLSFISKTKKVCEAKMRKVTDIYPPLTEMEKLPSGKIIVCTSDGTDKGKFLGVYYG
jgi:hypothetical protein